MNSADDTKVVPLPAARNRLFLTWAIGAGVPFLILFFQSILGKYDGLEQDVWSWFLPNVVPGLTLMIGVLAATAINPRTSGNVVRKSYFYIALGLSIFYLAILFLTVVLVPFSGRGALEVYSMSNFFIAPLAGLTSAAIGVLFADQRADQGD